MNPLMNPVLAAPRGQGGANAGGGDERVQGGIAAGTRTLVVCHCTAERQLAFGRVPARGQLAEMPRAAAAKEIVGNVRNNKKLIQKLVKIINDAA